jgi:hypothetical protein
MEVSGKLRSSPSWIGHMEVLRRAVRFLHSRDGACLPRVALPASHPTEEEIRVGLSGNLCRCPDTTPSSGRLNWPPRREMDYGERIHANLAW